MVCKRTSGGGSAVSYTHLDVYKRQVPMHHQYEQQCNALSMERLGVPIIWKESEFDEKLKNWVESDQLIEVNFPDETAEIVRKTIEKYS